MKDKNSDHTGRWPGRSAWNKIVPGRCASVGSNHTEMNIVVVPRLLSVHYCDHTVGLGVPSFVLVVHEGEFEPRGVFDLVFRVGTLLLYLTSHRRKSVTYHFVQNVLM